MPHSRTTVQSLPHAVFLQRVSTQQPPTSLEARLGQAAFLALRLVDLLAPGREGVSPEAFQYQWVATDRCCRELAPAATEGAHVHGITTAALEAHQADDVRLLVPALFAYAHLLEDELRLEEALDVLGTLVHVGGARWAAADAVAAWLRMGRVNRKLNRFEAAEAAYAKAEGLAAGHGDRYSELLSRIGSANTVLGRGNLAEAERRLLAILADARAAQLRDAEARAEQGLGVVLVTRGQPDLAVPRFWRAFELYEDENSQQRALGDVGAMMLMLGNPVAAEQALSEVVRRGAPQDVAHNAMIELMHCASFRRDRVGFERWRERCGAQTADMPPNILADFHLKQGIGLARFGQFRRAEALLEQALATASAAGLHEAEFRIERIKHGLRDCERQLQMEQAAAAEPAFETGEVREVSSSLAQLVGA